MADDEYGDDFWDDTPEAGQIDDEEEDDEAQKSKSGGHNKGGLFCPNCGSKEFESNIASGETICIKCGTVAEENVLVNSVQFSEGAGGASSMVGQFVSSSRSTAFSKGNGSKFGFSRDSRETTLMNGRRRIQEVASRLRLGQHFVDCAHRMYVVAVEKNFVQGRKGSHVVAACLYMACRMENSQHMLIDFSDALSVNVYTLGTCFLKFRRMLGYKLKIVDPALYVYRFAAHLDLGDKTNPVALTALRIVGRMQRDWIVAGRRPAGICAAALLIAARAHGFSRSKHDVTKVLRVCGVTVQSRVREFEHTPSSSLTLNQFHECEIEAEADPPSFTRNRFREARALAIQEGNVKLLESGALDDPRDGNKKTSWRQKKMSERQKLMSEMYSSIEKDLMDALQDGEQSEAEEGQPKRITAGPSSQTEGENNNLALANVEYPKGGNGRDLILPNQATQEEREYSIIPSKMNMTEWKENMPDHLNLEMEDLFRDDEEVAQKEAIFNSINKDYLAKLKQKEQDRKDAEAEAAKKKAEEGKDGASDNRKGRKRKNADSSEGQSSAATTTNTDALQNMLGDDPTTEEVLFATISSRKVSRKINYEAMGSLFDDGGGFTTESLTDAPTFGTI